MKDLCQQCSPSKMGAEIIPGLLDSIRKATTVRKEYGGTGTSAKLSKTKG